MSAKTASAILVSLALLLAAATLPATAAINSLSRQPLAFTENRGQWDERVLFKAEGAGGLTWWLERDGFTVVYTIPDETETPWRADFQSALDRPPPDLLSRLKERTESPPSKSGHALKFRFVRTTPPYSPPAIAGGATSESPLLLKGGTEGGLSDSPWLTAQARPASAREVIPSDRLSHNNNYFLGNDYSKWAPNCGNYQRVIMRDVWEGVDVEWYGVNFPPYEVGGEQGGVGLVEFDFVVNPGADPNQIQLRVDGLESALELTAEGGEIILPTSLGEVKMAMPEAWVVDADADGDADGNEIAAKFVPVGDNCLGIALPEGYDADKNLIVDPLIYSTYLGGGSYDYANAICPDGVGGVVAAGYTNSDNFPVTEGAFQEQIGDSNYYDAFIARLNSDGSDLVYSTYLGGSSGDVARAITSDDAGGVFVTGYTYSENFPVTEGAFQEQIGDSNYYDAFIARLNSDGSDLLYSTYLGGNYYDCALAITSDGAGGVVAAGYTHSDNFPVTAGAFQEQYSGGGGYSDAFITRLNEDGSDLLYSTYLGGNYYDRALAITSDGAGGVVAAGYTYSDNFPVTRGAFQEDFSGSYDAFITRLNGDGSELIYSTYLGGSSSDYANAICPDGVGGVVAAGYTYSDNFPVTEGALQEQYNGGGYYDAFITRLNEDGSDLVYSTYLGGNYYDSPYAIISDGAGGVVAAGYTSSDNFPVTEGAFQEQYAGGGYSDAFIARLNGDGSDLVYSTYLGGSSGDYAYDMTSDNAGGVVLAGYTYSGNFPVTEGAFQEDFDGYLDAFISRIEIGLPMPGMLFGYVYDLTDGRPLNEALVLTSYGDSALTDEQGYWFFDRIRPGLFDLTASKFGYNDSTLTGFELAPEETLEVDFNLRHPTISIDAEEFSAILNLDEAQEYNFNIANDGNGMLRWTGSVSVAGIEDPTPLTRRGFIRATENVNDDQLMGVAFADSRYYVAGANGDSPNLIYVLDREGSFVDSFQQAGQARLGMHDLEWDGDKLWGSGESAVYAFSTGGDLITSWEGPENVNQAIAWDDVNGLLWISSVTGANIYAYDQFGNQVETISHHGWRIYGLAWWADDPDHYPLYVLHRPEQNSQVLSKVNPENDDTMFVARFDVPGTPAGAAITADYDLYTVNLLTIVNAEPSDGGDRIDLWLLNVNTGWCRIEPSSGEVVPGEHSEVTLTLDASGLHGNNRYEGTLALSHNAAGEGLELPVELGVRGAPRPPSPFNLAYPADGDTTAVPQVAFGWERSLDPNPEDVVSYLIWVSSGADSLSAATEDTTVTLGLDTLGLRFSDETGASWWVWAVSEGDTVVCAARFNLYTRGLTAGEPVQLPAQFHLADAFPNPFNHYTMICYNLPATSQILIRVFDLGGREVTTAVNGVVAAGRHEVVWDAGTMPAGVYLVRMETSAGFNAVTKAVLVK